VIGSDHFFRDAIIRGLRANSSIRIIDIESAAELRPGREGRVMGQGNPTRRKASLGWALRLGILGALTAAAGCDSGSSSSGGAAPLGKTPILSGTGAGTSPAGDGGQTGKQAATEIEGDRMTKFAPVVMSKQTESSPFRFAEIAKEAGIDFVHFSGMTTEKHFPTANGSGVAVFDYDHDGLLDIYFASATLLPLGTAVKGPNRLYKNLGNNRFRDETEKSGLGYRGFCHGVIAGDIDNDGDVDVFLCNYGSNVLYLNDGNGTFKDISKSAGIDKPNWSSGGAMLDYDNDGYLDIYVSVYGIWNYPQDHHLVGDAVKKVWLYSSPRTITPTRHLFYHNNRNGTFTDVYDKVITAEKDARDSNGELVKDPKTGAVAKVRVPTPRDDGHGFGVVAADVNDDGLIDLYVANDMNPNFLFLNRGDGTFDDATDLSGAAFDINGQAQSGMGVDAEDVNGDGLPELFVTNFANEYNTLYMNYGKGSFFDHTAFYGLASDTMPWVGWGCALSDLDGDGWPDCFTANGHVDNNRKDLGQPVDYEEIPLLFHNIEWKDSKGNKGRRFRLATRDAGPYFDSKHVARGAAFGDIDNDGDIDIVINHKDGPGALLRNDTKSKNHWIRMVLQGTRSNRDAIGAQVEVTIDDQLESPPRERTIYRQRKGGYSLQGTNDPRVLVGIGPVSRVKKVVIRWPSGIVSTLENLEVDRDHKVVEPKDGKPVPHVPRPEKNPDGSKK
jgi:enediyne biosynthesis protein E4